MMFGQTNIIFTPIVLYFSRLTSENDKLRDPSLRGFRQDSATLSPYVQTDFWALCQWTLLHRTKISVTCQWQQNSPTSVSTVNVSQSNTARPSRLRPCHSQCEVPARTGGAATCPEGQTAPKYKRLSRRGRQRIGVRQAWYAQRGWTGDCIYWKERAQYLMHQWWQFCVTLSYINL